MEFNELEGDIDTYTEGETLDGTSRLDIDYLDVDFLTDVLDVVEELVKTTSNYRMHKHLLVVEQFNYRVQLSGLTKIHSLISLKRMVT